MIKYILFADASSPHTLKWLKEQVKHFDVYLISLNGYSEEVLNYIDKSKLFVLNNKVNSKGGNYKLLLKFFELKNIVTKVEPDIINAHYISSYGFLASLIKMYKPEIFLLQSTWGSDILVEPFRNKLRYLIAEYSLNKANLITSDSYYMSDTIEKIVKDKEISTFSFGLDKIDTQEYEKNNLIFSNRALSKNYNVAEILNWFSKQSDIYSLVIANNGIEREKLKKLSLELGIADKVKFVGFLNAKEQDEYYKKSKYYISIPTSDATSVSLLEAMNFGCIPIVSNIASNREWIINNINGIFFKKDILLDNVSFSFNAVAINREILNNNGLFKKSIKELNKKIEESLNE